MFYKTKTTLNGNSKTVSKYSNYFTVKRIALLAVLTSLISVWRVFFVFIPNVQPMTALLIIVALNIGVIDSLVMSVLSVLLTNLFLGMGPWTGMQIISFAIIILLTGVLKNIYQFGSIYNRIAFSIWTLITGFLFGFIISYLNYKLYGLESFLVYYISGLAFDGMHGLGNLVFYFILEPLLVPIIRRKISKFN